MTLHSEILPYPTISDHDIPCINMNVPTNKFEIRYKFIRNLKHFNLETFPNYFKTLPFTVVCSLEKNEDQLHTLTVVSSLEEN